MTSAIKPEHRIKVVNEDITIRPSSVDNFYQCAYQWGKVFLEGVTTIPGARAAIGTAIHRSAEVYWNEAIETGTVDDNLSKLTDAAMESWKEEAKKGIRFDDGENENTAASEIIKGTQTFVDDIAPYAQIPDAVEQRFSVDIHHPLVKRVSGTVDYISKHTIADLKTSKRKPSPPNYTTQQSIYKYLAVANGHDIRHNLIHGVVLKAKPEGMILPMEPKVEQAKALVNGLLDTLDVIHQDIVPIETILRPNPKYYLCSPKYCSLYGNGCPATSGHDLPAKPKTIKL
jgi:hypothetical protein